LVRDRLQGRSGQQAQPRRSSGDGGGAPSDGAKDSAKDGDKGKEANGKDAKGTDAGAGKDAPSKDKADKPAEKAPAESKKPAAPAAPGKSSARIHTPGRGKSAAKRPIKRPVHKAKRRV
jgi:hypothetical protein